MKRLEKQMALLVNEINDFKTSVERLDKINDQLKATKIKMDVTEYKSIIEAHQQQMASNLKLIKDFENRFYEKIKQAKIYPNWAVVVFILSLVLGIGGSAFIMYWTMA
tara:strand:- start:14 stop:337 length:324 start_codon:yes stop_codon:yes gene_type:complete